MHPGPAGLGPMRISSIAAASLSPAWGPWAGAATSRYPTSQQQVLEHAQRRQHRYHHTSICMRMRTAAAAAGSSSSDSSYAMLDPYAVLGVRSDASLREIKQAYRRLALLYHPDVCCNGDQRGFEFQRLRSAYERIVKSNRHVASKKEQDEKAQASGKVPLDAGHGQHLDDLGESEALDFVKHYYTGILVDFVKYYYFREAPGPESD